MFDKGFAAGPDAAASDEPAAGPVDAPGRVEAVLSALQHLGHVGVWDLDIATGTMWWSDGLYTIHGYPPDSFPASLDRLVANTHPGDRAAFTEQLHALITNGRELDVISRVVRPDSSPRYVHRRGSLLRDSDGNPCGSVRRQSTSPIPEFWSPNAMRLLCVCSQAKPAIECSRKTLGT